MKIKILKEAKPKQNTNEIVHAFIITLDLRHDRTSLCGQPGDKYSWNNNVHLKKVTCPNCLVLADQLLEAGKITLAHKDEMRAVPTALLKVVYSQEIVTDYASEESYGEWSKEMNSKFLGVCLKTNNPYHIEYKASEEIGPGDKVYVAWCTYSQGDTFGSATGEFDVLKISSKPLDIEEMRALGYEKHRDYFGGLDEVFIEETIVEYES
jgi:hypothetical protein